MCVPVVSKCPLLIRTQSYWVRDHPNDLLSSEFRHLHRPSFQMRSRIHRCGGLGLQCVLGETQFSPSPPARLSLLTLSYSFSSPRWPWDPPNKVKGTVKEVECLGPKGPRPRRWVPWVLGGQSFSHLPWGVITSAPHLLAF